MPSPRLMVAADAFALAEATTAEALRQALGSSMQAAGLAVAAEVELAAGLAPHGLGKLTDWFDVFRICQVSRLWSRGS